MSPSDKGQMPSAIHLADFGQMIAESCECVLDIGHLKATLHFSRI